METFTVDVYRAENRPLNVPLIAPFTIASSRLEMVENVAVRIELSNGSVGWGEAPILPFVTAEDQKTAMAKASEACAFLRRCPSLTLGSMLEDIGNSDEFFKVAAPLETLGRAAAELRIMKRTRIGMDLQFDMVEVDAFVKQPDGLLFSWYECFQCYCRLMHGIVSSCHSRLSSFRLWS
ncbi:L-Ala-D/L-amino acid epimerase-like isoform X2 [Arachis ipaensis]|nr:L-Ala-D/L-amino acid epimerase-like isoform X2 [Arachis ipaensis]